VGGDRARTNIGALADLRVTDVAEVRNLRARTNRRILRLHERADLTVRAQVGSGPQVREGADGCAGPDHRVARVSARYAGTSTHLHRLERRVGADDRARLDARRTLQLGAGQNLNVFGEHHVAVDPRRVGVDDGD